MHHLARTIKQYDKGLDVLGVKRALARAGYKGLIQNETAGMGFVSVVKQLQRDNGLDRSGWYGVRTDEALTAARQKGTHNPAFDAQADEWVNRESLRLTALSYFDHRPLHYSQARPIWPVVHSAYPPTMPPGLDCSGMFISCYGACGLLSRLGTAAQGGYGNTYTLNEVSWAKRISLWHAQPGDAVLYAVPGDSQSPPNHVGMYVGVCRGVKRARVDHGHEGGPTLGPADFAGQFPIYAVLSYF